MKLAVILCKLINNSFSTGLVPDELKIAKVCPIYKNGDRAQFSNYRPISILPSFSKLYEKLVCNRLMNYLSKHSILYNNKCKKPWFIQELTAHHTLKTAKIAKR